MIVKPDSKFKLWFSFAYHGAIFNQMVTTFWVLLLHDFGKPILNFWLSCYHSQFLKSSQPVNKFMVLLLVASAVLLYRCYKKDGILFRA